MKVTVLGCGPSGLFAAKAAEDVGYEVEIISRKLKSSMPGAIYVHNAVPGVTGDKPDAYVTFVKVGSKVGYARKVYGSPNAECSWDLFPQGTRPAWDMRAAYDRLWERYNSYIVERDVTPDTVTQLLHRGMVVCAIPAPVICYGDHVFEQKQIWLRRKFPQPSYLGGIDEADWVDPVIVYNGDPGWAWYRASSLFGYQAMEFGHNVYNCETGIKPLTTTCDCFRDRGLIRAGRFGEWRKGVLLTDAYKQVREALS